MIIIYNKILYKFIFVSLEMFFFKFIGFNIMCNIVSIFIFNYFCYNKCKEIGIGIVF